jgi:hypothetical protein
MLPDLVATWHVITDEDGAALRSQFSEEGIHLASRDQASFIQQVQNLAWSGGGHELLTGALSLSCAELLHQMALQGFRPNTFS